MNEDRTRRCFLAVKVSEGMHPSCPRDRPGRPAGVSSQRDRRGVAYGGSWLPHNPPVPWGHDPGAAGPVPAHRLSERKRPRGPWATGIRAEVGSGGRVLQRPRLPQGALRPRRRRQVHPVLLRGLASGRAGAIGLPLPPADFPFNPHITLGRFNRDLTPEESRHLEDALRRFDGRVNVLVAIFDLTWTVTGACIMESVRTRSGVEYRIVTDQKPEHGWSCFHCGDIFTTYGEAYMHFGLRPTSPPACRLDPGVLIDLRASEDRVAELEDRVAELEEALGELQG